MSERALAIVLSTLSLFNSFPAFGLAKSEPTQSRKYTTIGIGLGAAVALPAVLILLNKAFDKAEISSNNKIKGTTNTYDIKSWKDVSVLVFQSSRKRKKLKWRNS